MDLDEFLFENGIPANAAQNEAPQAPQPPPAPAAKAPHTPSVVDLSSRATTSVHTGMGPQSRVHSPAAGRTESEGQGLVLRARVFKCSEGQTYGRSSCPMSIYIYIYM